MEEQPSAGSTPEPELDARVRALLAAIASRPRSAGSAGEARARSLAADWLRELGFTVTESHFAYSRLPGRWGTPLAGLTSAGALAATGHLGRWGSPGAGLALLLLAGLGLLVGGRWLTRHGVLRLPVMRGEGANLLAGAGAGAAHPSVWLVAHLDSKSQPVSIGVRAAGVVASLLSWLAMGALLLAALTIAPIAPAGWVIVTLVGVASALPLIASIVGDRSDGAVDNASGVAAVLAAVAVLPPRIRARVGVALTSGEELGLAGARAWAAGTAPAMAINCDSVDDRGEWVIMYSGRKPESLVDALVAAHAAAPGGALPHGRPAIGDIRPRRLLPGILTDHLALTDAGWTAVTVSRGDTSTLRRIHTRRDDLSALRGDALLPTASILAGATARLSEDTRVGSRSEPSPPAAGVGG